MCCMLAATRWCTTSSRTTSTLQSIHDVSHVSLSDILDSQFSFEFINLFLPLRSVHQVIVLIPISSSSLITARRFLSLISNSSFTKSCECILSSPMAYLSVGKHFLNLHLIIFILCIIGIFQLRQVNFLLILIDSLLPLVILHLVDVVLHIMIPHLLSESQVILSRFLIKSECPLIPSQPWCPILLSLSIHILLSFIHHLSHIRLRIVYHLCTFCSEVDVG